MREIIIKCPCCNNQMLIKIVDDISLITFPDTEGMHESLENIGIYLGVTEKGGE